MKRTAVLLTVFNRKEITLRGIRSLFKAIDTLGEGYKFDIYMTDDGSTDGTADVVIKEFPEVHIIHGNGNLYWGGGMRMAWQAAIESEMDYDYYLWYNDDSFLYDNALQIMFESINENSIVTGAFCDHNHVVSYGGRNGNNSIIEPNGKPQDVVMMNGNLVLIPYEIYENIGIITPRLVHGGGDFEYGYRVIKAEYKILLSKDYVGISDRHDEIIPQYCSPELSLRKRWCILHNPIYSPFDNFIINIKFRGFFQAMKSFAISYVGMLIPSLYGSFKRRSL